MHAIKTPLATGKREPLNLHFNPLNAYLNFVDSQQDKHTLWWCISLIIHGNLVLFIPAFLIWYCNAPIIVLAITILAFFGNLVVNMSGASIRVTLTAFFGSLLINMLMILIYVF